MQIISSLDQISEPFVNPYVTIGNFDGVHLGHQMLFSEVVQKAYRNNGTAIAITFFPHPLQVLLPDFGLKLISTAEQKEELIALANIKVLLVLPFNKTFAAISAESFVDEVLIRKIGVHELVVGYDYAFGKGRQGDINFLKAQGKKKGFDVSVVEPYYVDGMLASSTKVRELVKEGRMRDVQKLLGRYYQIRGVVAKGKQRGASEIGFPTANLHIDDHDLSPRHGVYVCQVIYGGKCYGGVMNIGYNPTFNGQSLIAEVHIFDFNQDIYGQPIKINFLKFIRDEKKFSSIEALANQIQHDIGEAKSILNNAQKELLLSCTERYNR